VQSVDQLLLPRSTLLQTGITFKSKVKPLSQRARRQASFRALKLGLPLLLNCVYTEVFMGEGRMKKAWSYKDNTK
jgi:hypothetical protein